MSREILQLVPRLPPPSDGVAGTALTLAKALSRAGVENRVQAISAHNLESRLAEAHGAAVVLHYVNYGYDPHGCPEWLADGIDAWLDASPSGPLWLYSHEVYASAPFWRRTFWSGPRQRRIASRLARRASFILTSLELYRDLLRDLGATAEIEVRPIISAIGETLSPAPFAARKPWMAVFGSSGVRRRAYGPHGHHLERAARMLGCERIVDIGPGRDFPSSVGGIPVDSHGEREADEVAQLLGGCRAGFLVYPLGFLAKSSIFAAYAAHGLLPVCTGRSADHGLAPQAARHYWQVDGQPISTEHAAELASAATAWYNEHGVTGLATALRDRAQR